MSQLWDAGANDFSVIDATRSVTLFRRTGEAAFDTGTVVANAFREDVRKEQHPTKHGTVSVLTARWHIWSGQLATEPKFQDVIADTSEGTRWSILSVDKPPGLGRWVCETVKEAV